MQKKKKIKRYGKRERRILLEAVNRRIVEGECLNSILKDEKMPSKFTFFCWIKEDKEAKEEYQLAQRMRATFAIDEIIEIADNKGHDYISEKVVGKKGEVLEVKRYNYVRYKQRRLQIDTRKWEACKLLNIYRDKIEHTGEVNTSLEVKKVIDVPPQETREEWESRIQKQRGEK